MLIGTLAHPPTTLKTIFSGCLKIAADHGRVVQQRRGLPRYGALLGARKGAQMECYLVQLAISFPRTRLGEDKLA